VQLSQTDPREAPRHRRHVVNTPQLAAQATVDVLRQKDTSRRSGVEVGRVQSPASASVNDLLRDYRHCSELGRLVLNTCILTKLSVQSPTAAQFSLGDVNEA